mgnify:CR=1 FL=1
MSRLITNAIRSTSASADAITMDGSGNVTFPANATCSGTATGFGGGKVLQVKQVVKTDSYSFVSSSGDDRRDITGLTINITPSSTSSKILVEYRTNVGGPDGGYRIMVHLMRGSSDIYRGDQDSGQTSQTRCSNHINTINDSLGNSRTALATGQFLDSPNTTNSTTYKLQIHTVNSGSTYYINRNSWTTSNTFVGRQPSHITVTEVAA